MNTAGGRLPLGHLTRRCHRADAFASNKKKGTGSGMAVCAWGLGAGGALGRLGEPLVVLVVVLDRPYYKSFNNYRSKAPKSQ